MISNPFSNHLFFPLLATVAGVLALAMVVIVFAERHRLRQLASSSLFIRWRTWAVIAPVALLVAFSGTLIVTAAVALLAVIGLLEYISITRLSRRSRAHMATIVFFGIAIAIATAVVPEAVFGVLLLGLLTVAVVTIMQSNGTGFEDAALSSVGLIYLPILGSFAILISATTGGAGLLLAAMTASGLSNIGAFVFGKLWGKHKLSPVSPNKTYEGVVGSFVGSYAGFTLLWFALPQMPLWLILTLPSMIAIAAIIGDLFESLLKRSFNVKDAAQWLPGFGGALDRIDGLLFVLPVTYYAVHIFH